MKQSNNDMNIDLLRAMRGIWIIEIETIKKQLRNYTGDNYLIVQTKLFVHERCLQDLIDIIGED